ncbi:GNAT family N-acetyltransferase [Streptomyces sp. NBC_01218]|uniref:GNAT family N-acetyltransferase n=1 Tax=Streptomyces sp. NBC_01218 TaxID=2903780 RepID=UPI002E15D962|nr:GNAT family N-acetyltransferase [Streptomyces sp. NBC_01218]
MSEAHVTDHRPAPASHGSGPVDVPAPRRESPAPSGHPLDHPSLSALHGPHAHFAERRGRVVRYPADVSPWTAMPDEPDARDWADAAALAGPGAFVMFMGAAQAPPADWEDGFEIEGVQLTGEGLRTEAYPEAVRLGAADVPEMLDLVERTRPGPFLPRTVEMGTYLGVRRGGELVAMAGERVHPAGWTEISAVCTDPVVRGQGLAGRLVLAVAHGITERGETPFLHAAADNTGAIRLYEALGFRLRRGIVFRGATAPKAPSRAS